MISDCWQSHEEASSAAKLAADSKLQETVAEHTASTRGDDAALVIHHRFMMWS